MRVVAAALGSLEGAAEFTHGRESLCTGKDLDIHIGKISAIKRGSEGPPVAMAKPGSLERLHRFVIDI